MQVSQHSIEKDLHNSFSWVEYPEGKTKSPKKSTKKTVGLPTTATTAGTLQEELQEIQNRLEWLENQQSLDRQDYYDQLRQAKQEVREELYAKYEPVLSQNNSKKYEGQVRETSKIINYLRDDNARIREEIATHKRNIAKVKRSNQEAEAALASAQKSHQELEEHVQEMEAVQAKLEDNSKIFKEALQNMKADLYKRTSFYDMEVATISKYESCLAKVLIGVQSSTEKSKTSESVEQQVLQMTQEAAEIVTQGRQAQLARVGLQMDSRQTKQTQRLLNPDLLVLDHKRKSADYDSDDDSTTVSGEDSTDYEVESDQ